MRLLTGTLVPAYGRDYKSQAKVLSDFSQEKDFLINDLSGELSLWDGKPTNSEQLYKLFGPCRIQVRYNQLRSSVFLEVLGRKIEEPRYLGIQADGLERSQLTAENVYVMDCRIHRPR